MTVFAPLQSKWIYADSICAISRVELSLETHIFSKTDDTAISVSVGGAWDRLPYNTNPGGIDPGRPAFEAFLGPEASETNPPPLPRSRWRQPLGEFTSDGFYLMAARLCPWSFFFRGGTLTSQKIALPGSTVTVNIDRSALGQDPLGCEYDGQITCEINLFSRYCGNGSTACPGFPLFPGFFSDIRRAGSVITFSSDDIRCDINGGECYDPDADLYRGFGIPEIPFGYESDEADPEDPSSFSLEYHAHYGDAGPNPSENDNYKWFTDLTLTVS